MFQFAHRFVDIPTKISFDCVKVSRPVTRSLCQFIGKETGVDTLESNLQTVELIGRLDVGRLQRILEYGFG